MQEATYAEVEAEWMVHTNLGRCRLLSSAKGLLKAQRKGFNFKIQSGLADYVKIFLIKFAKIFPPLHRVVFSVFDAFLLEAPDCVPESEIRGFIDEALSGISMKFRYKLNSGDNWHDAQTG